jgi:hypothetical protein
MPAFFIGSSQTRANESLDIASRTIQLRWLGSSFHSENIFERKAYP